MRKVPHKILESYGNIPSGWRIEKLKYFANVQNSNVDKAISEDEVEVNLCNYTDVYYNDYITSDMNFMRGSATEAEIKRFQLKSGQVIITKDSEGWEDIAIPALVIQDMPTVLCGYHLSVFDPGPELEGSFLAWLCRSEPLNEQFKIAANGVTRFGLGQYSMKNAFIVVPPLNTQQRIAYFLDEKTTKINQLRFAITGNTDVKAKSSSYVIEKNLLDLLIEYRTALINAAVTGRIKELI